MPSEKTFYSHLYLTEAHARVETAAVIVLHYSAACRTVWAVLSAARPGTTATLHRNSDNAELHCTAGPDGSCATNQLSDISVASHASASSGRAYGRTRGDF